MEKNIDKNFSCLKSWLLIFLLSLLPGFIFQFDWNPEGEKTYRQKIAQQQWYNKLDRVAQNFYKSTEIEFWQKQAADRFKNSCMAYLLKSNNLLHAAERAALAYKPAAFPPADIQFFYRGNDSEKWQIETFGKKVIASEFMMRALFQEMLKGKTGKSEGLNSPKWEQRIKSLFGHMIFPALFSAEFKAVVFSVQINKRFYNLIWDLIEDPHSGKVLGGFFCFFPLKELDSPERLPIELIFKHWKLVGPNQKAFPAILPIDERSAKIHVHSAIRSPELEKELRKFRKTYFSRVKSLVAELADKARLPGELFGKVFKVGEFSARLCSLSPVSGSVGLLLGKPESLDKSLRQYMVQAYFLIISILWGMALIKVMVFRKLPPVNLRFRIMAWFLAFAAFPVGLTIGAWSSLLQDFARFRVKELQSALFTASQNIEAGLTDIDNRFLKASRQCLGQSEVVAMLEQLPEIPETEKDFFSLLQKKFNDENISISGTMVIMQGGWCFSDFDKTVTKRMRNTLNTGIASLLEKYLRENNPVLYAKMQVPEEHADKKLLSMGSLFAVNTYRNLGALPRFFDRVTDLRIDRRDYLQFIYQHFSKGEPLALIIVLWDWNHEFRELITSLLQKETLRFRKNWGNVPDIAVFKSTSAGNRMLAKVGDLNSLLPLSDFPAAGFKALSDKDSASVIIPSTRIESIKFVARVTTSNIALIVADEKVFIVLSVIATLFMMQLGATVVSGWIAGPVNKLSKALGLLSQGQTSRPEISNRQDEITTAQTALVKMFAWIEERERLLPFVSPKALDAVAGGNVFKAGAGVMQEVTILVSDIRSFTSLTENYPANQVFAMINAHLKEMASVIQGHSGVIDRFVGDAVWAVFFDPHPQGGKSALKAAAAMVRAHQRIQDKRRARGEFSYQIGVGLVRGNILAGVLGEASVRLDFTVIGDMLKQAEKLESLSRHSTGSGIIFSGNLSDCADELGIDYQPLMTDEDVLEVANLDV